MKIPDFIFLLASIASFLIALVHIIIIFMGRKGYEFFGAAQLIPLLEKSASRLALITFILAIIFVICGVYGLSGARVFPHLVLLRLVLIIIAAGYILRGLAFVKEVILVFGHSASVPTRELVFSSVSLIVGLLYLTGLVLNWSTL